jgi:uncharacterized protein YndB with AHSA1/START domain
MSDLATLSPYGVRTETTTVRIQRLLPGPIERVWAYLTESDLRRQWLASGPMELKAGGAAELTWRNGELTPHEEARPEGMPEERKMTSQVLRADPPRLLAFTWGEGDVTFELAPQGTEVLLTVTHRRLLDRGSLLNVSAGWHAHLDLLADRLSDREPGPFWRHWSELKAEYEARLGE